VPDIVRCRFDHTACGQPEAFELTEPIGQLVAWKLSDVVAVLGEAEKAARRGLYVAGFVAYEAAPAFDAALAVRAGQPLGERPPLPLAWFGLFRQSHRAAALAPVNASCESWSCEIDSAEHAEAVDRIQRAIAAGRTYLVNYTTRFVRPLRRGEQPFALYRQLVNSYAGGYHAYLETSDWAVACGSPELFFELDARQLTTRPMKGTAARGRWVDEDRERGEGLRHSSKERAENVMVVDLLRNDIGRIAVAGTVAVPRLWEVERHPTLWQLTSTVTGTTRSGTGLPDVFAALFPSGSVTGAPKVSSMASIAQLERSPRGVYCGAVGFVRSRSPSDRELMSRFAVAIRTAVVDKLANRVVYGSGGGISWDSLPAAEWKEVLLKTASLARTVPPIAPRAGLIETMGYLPASPGHRGGVRNLHKHLARLAASAEYLGLPVPSDAADRVAAAVSGWANAARVRLVLRPDGTVEVEVSALVALDSAGGMPMLCIDREPVASSEAGLFHKTTDRSRYDERSARHPRADDVVLVNERGEVTETTRANLAVRLDGRWWTPPLDCGLLPGVERARLLDSGRLRERVVTVEELARAGAFATLSSLRGWRAAGLHRHCVCSE